MAARASPPGPGVRRGPDAVGHLGPDVRSSPLSRKAWQQLPCESDTARSDCGNPTVGFQPPDRKIRNTSSHATRYGSVCFSFFRKSIFVCIERHVDGPVIVFFGHHRDGRAGFLFVPNPERFCSRGTAAKPSNKNELLPHVQTARTHTGTQTPVKRR